jgi:hypothetical protein
MDKSLLREKYLGTAIFYRTLEKREDRLVLILSFLRFVVFIGGFIVVWIGFTKSVIVGILLFLLCTILFLCLVKLFSNHSTRREFMANLTLINQNEVAAISGNFSAFDDGNSYTDIRHDFSFDIDLFGSASLFQYLNRTVTGYGRDILASWLSDSFSLSKELVPRQEAIKELASKDKWRHEFIATGMKIPLEKGEISGLLRWIEERPLTVSSSLKKLLIFVLPASACASLLLMIAAILPYQIFVLIFLINLFFIAAGLKKINEIHNALTKKYNFLTSIKGLLLTFENEIFVSPVLNNIK